MQWFLHLQCCLNVVNHRVLNFSLKLFKSSLYTIRKLIRLA
uniref:Uncharacterized protein n=1 Tax=Anguilla anguilla TaxID=7936 RepID=A0A0E9TVY1_ANGAN